MSLLLINTLVGVDMEVSREDDVQLSEPAKLTAMSHHSPLRKKGGSNHCHNRAISCATLDGGTTEQDNVPHKG